MRTVAAAAARTSHAYNRMMQANDRESILNWLAGVLMDRSPAWPFAPGDGVDAVVEVANAEGVAALLQARLHASGTVVPDQLHAVLATAVRAKAAQSLYRQAQCRAVLARLDEIGINALVLKGMALAQWAYAEPYWRDSGDIDLLFASREHVERAVEAISPLGYRQRGLLMPGDLVRFETTCESTKASGGLEIDLHWHLSNAPVFAFRFDWDALWADSMALPGLAPGARGLSPAMSLLHACMHRAKHMAAGEDRMKWLYDMVVVSRPFGDHDWQVIRQQAAAKGLAGVCLESLRDAEITFGKFLPGDTLAELAALACHETLRAARLRSKWYFQRMNWRAFPTTRMRWRWLWQQLVPDAAYLRKRYETPSVVVALWRRFARGVRWVRG